MIQIECGIVGELAWQFFFVILKNNEKRKIFKTNIYFKTVSTKCALLTTVNVRKVRNVAQSLVAFLFESAVFSGFRFQPNV